MTVMVLLVTGAPVLRAHEKDITPKLCCLGRAGPLSPVSKPLQLDRAGRRAVRQRRQHVPRHRWRRCCFWESAKQFGMARALLGGRKLESEIRLQLSRSQGIGPYLEGDRFLT